VRQRGARTANWGVDQLTIEKSHCHCHWQWHWHCVWGNEMNSGEFSISYFELQVQSGKGIFYLDLSLTLPLATNLSTPHTNIEFIVSFCETASVCTIV
jgi:hypothetical protein